MIKRNKWLLDSQRHYRTQNLNYFLSFFKDIFAHTDILFNQFQNRQTTGVDLKHAVHNFTCAIPNVSQRFPHNIVQNTEVKRRLITSPFVDACEECDILTTHITDRLQKSDFFMDLSVVELKCYKDKATS